MKQRITSRYFTIVLWLILCSSILKAQIHPIDSAQLVSLYNATCNSGCTLNWNLEAPSTWEGIEFNQNRVVKIRLDSMNLTGSIPPDLNLPNLTHLHLFNNNLSGNIPNFNNLIALKVLRLERNQLEGSVPNLENQVNLTHLILNTNRLTGEVPNFDSLANLRLISLNVNQISGNIPNFNNPELYWIDVSNNRMTGTIPNFDLPNLTDIDFAFNNFSGPVPSFEFTDLKKLNLGSNQLTGPIPDFSELTNLASIRMYSNNLTDSIPNFNLPELTLLYLYGNELTDNIPNFDSVPNLEELYLQNNKLTGEIPTNFNLPALRYLWLQGNELTGTIPDFSGMPELEWIDLNSNELSGTIPDFSTLNNLDILLLGNNKFSFGEVQEAKNHHDDLPFFRYSPQFHGSVQLKIHKLGDSTVLTLSNPLPGNNNDVTYQWQQNGNMLSGSIDSTYAIDSLDLTQVGKYTLHMTDVTRVPDLEIISKPVYEYVKGYDLTGQPVVYNQLMVEFESIEQKNIYEEDYLIPNGIPTDSCSCNRLLYLWEFEDEETTLEVLLALNTKTESQTGKAKVSGLNNIFQLSLFTPGEGWKWTGDYSGSYPDTVRVYMLDSGLDTTNLDIENHLIPNAPVDSCHNNLSSYGYDYTNPLISITTGTPDSVLHGSFGVYSIVDDLPENINIKIVPLKVFDDAGQGTLFDFVCGLYHAIDHGADIINVSAGYYGEPSEILEDAIALAQQKDIFIIAATGNDTLDIDSIPQYPAYYAGRFYKKNEYGTGGEWVHFNNVKSVISIGAQDEPSPFTNYNKDRATLAAYGEDMGGYLPTGDEVSLSGTSVAAFYVTKQLAVEIAKNKNRDYNTIWEDFEASSLRDCPSIIDLTETGKCLDIDLEIYGDFKVFLEGAYNASTQQMSTTLNTGLHLLPGQINDTTLNHTIAIQPYNVAPFYYEGNEAVSEILDDYPPEVVDWLLISLRTDINIESEVARTAAWLRNDGRIQLLKPLLKNTEVDYHSVYIVIEHRNHIGVMSPEKIPIQRNIITWDFTQQNSYTSEGIGAGQIEVSPDVWLMFAGDGDQSNDAPGYDINGSDKIIWGNNNGNFDEYLPSDYNLDGDVNGGDKPYWQRNNGISSRVPR